MTDIDLNRLSNISIRGRVAFSLCCLNTLIKKFKLDDLEWEFLFEKLWQYTSTKYLDEWHMEFAEYIPETIMHYDKYDKNDFEYVTDDLFNRLRILYSELNEDVKEIINLVFYMGTIELYGKVQKRGKSFEYFEEIIRLMIKYKVSLPRISQFEKYEFDKGDGWGDMIKREDVSFV